jgi:hypothetical protein
MARGASGEAAHQTGALCRSVGYLYHGEHRTLAAEVGPFFALSFAELGLSTTAVSAAARWATASRFGTTDRTLAAETANLPVMAPFPDGRPASCDTGGRHGRGATANGTPF